MRQKAVISSKMRRRRGGSLNGSSWERKGGSRNGRFLREERGGRYARVSATSGRDDALCIWDQENVEMFFWMPESG
jgi:hypothetical protein